MPTFSFPSAVSSPPPTNENEGLELSVGQKLAIAAAALTLYGISRGKISQERGEKILRGAVKGFVGLGAGHMFFGIPGHGPRPEYTPGQPTTFLELIQTLPSPSNRYVEITGNPSGKKYTVSVEILEVLVNHGIVTPNLTPTGVVGAINMEKLWNADP